jgi:hypothetical protein
VDARHSKRLTCSRSQARGITSGNRIDIVPIELPHANEITYERSAVSGGIQWIDRPVERQKGVRET